MKISAKKLLLSGSLGGNFGLLISLAYNVLAQSPTYYPTNPASTVGQWLTSHTSVLGAILYSFALWCLMGVWAEIVSAIFQPSARPLTYRTFKHLLALFLPYLALGFLAGWFPLKLSALLSFVVIFLLLYGLIWLVLYLKTKREIQTINQKLR